MSKIDIRTLTCGVRVVMEKIDYVQSAAFGVWVKAGACDENKQNAGVSHFIEHMMFKGTEKRNARQIAEEIARVEKVFVGTSKKVQELLVEHGSTPLNSGISLAELIKRPELSYEILAPLDPQRPELMRGVVEQVNIHMKYDGYIQRQMRQVEQFQKLENKKIPEDLNYDDVPSLRTEARQKLTAVRPLSIGQASRISGVSPADISVLLVWLEHKK